MKRTTSQSIRLFSTASLAAVLAGSAGAVTVTWNGTGDPHYSDNNDQNIVTRGNGQADTIIINDVFNTNSSAYRVDPLDTFVIENGGVVRNTRNDKVIRGDGEGSGDVVFNVGTGGITAGNVYRDVEINLSGDGGLIFYKTVNQLNSSLVNMAPDWIGTIFFGETDDAGVLAYLDGSAAGQFILDGVPLTAADLGTKFELDVIAAETGAAPALHIGTTGLSGIDGFGVFMSLVSGPPSLPGDTDGDGDVDDADLGTSFSNYTGPLATGTGGKDASTGDNDGDGDVDDADLGTSFSNYTGPLTAAVPEPTSLALLGLGGLLVVRRRRA